MTTNHPREQADAVVLETDNLLLFEELRLIERYTAVIRHVPQEDMVEGLLKAQAAHEWAASLLRTDLLETGGPAWEAACRWETLSAECKEAEAAGEAAASCTLTALRRGEERCFERYATLMAREDVPQVCKDLVRTELLPVPLRNLEILRCVEALRELRFSRSPFGQSHW